MTPSLFETALAAHQRGDLPLAEAAYRDLLAAEPDHIDALSLLGVLLGAKGEHDEALGYAARAVQLDPQAALLHLNLGNVHMGRGAYDEAAARFREAVRLASARPEPFYNLGNALRLLGKWDEAEEAYRQAIRIAPRHFEARGNLALVHDHQEKVDEAMAGLLALVREAPSYGEAWLNLCKVAEKAAAYDVGLEAGLHAVALMQTNEKAWFGLGVILNRLARDEEALEAYQNALRIKPDWAEVWDNLGQTFEFLGRLDEAEKAYRATIVAANQEIDGEDTRRIDEREYGGRHWHLALLELLKGDYKRGFARYRARFEDVGGLKRPAFPVPVWQGEDLAGKTILVMDEQGMGDCLMLLRYLPLLKEKGATVWLLVHPFLVRYLEGWSGADRIIPRGQQVRDFDIYASIFDLPYGFGTTQETVPAQVPYLPVLAPDEHTALPEAEGRKKVGVVWGGAPKHKQDGKRSLPLQLFSKLFDIPSVQFFSLNRDKRDGDDALLAGSPVIDLAPRLNDFADAARFIAQMDLVITCDTATAHMAGGMGKEVWTLLPFAPDWRWMTGREDTPWYPTMKLFRQAQRGDWACVIDRVKGKLATQYFSHSTVHQ